MTAAIDDWIVFQFQLEDFADSLAYVWSDSEYVTSVHQEWKVDGWQRATLPLVTRDELRDDLRVTILRLRELLPSVQSVIPARLVEEFGQHFDRAIGLLHRRSPETKPMAEALADAIRDSLGRSGLDTIPLRADGKTDGKKKSYDGTPENPNVLKLAKRIRDNRDTKRTKIDIAREFTDGDETRAHSLLRKLRDYPHLLTRAD